MNGPGLHRPPRVWPRLPAGGPVVVAGPPAPEEARGTGWWMSLLPLVGILSMAIFAVTAASLTYLLMVGMLALTMVGAGLGTQLLRSRHDRSRRERLRRRYLDHLGKAEGEAATAAAVQRAALVGLFPDPAGLLSQVDADEGIWERRSPDSDFGAVRLGLGAVPALRPVVMSGPAGPLTEPDAELDGAVAALVRRSASLADAPIVVPLADLGTVAVVGELAAGRALVGSWVASLAAGHAPEELRVVGFARPPALSWWDWANQLPHGRGIPGPDGSDLAGPAWIGTTDGLHNLVELLRRSRTGAAGPGPLSGGGGPAEHVFVVLDDYDPGGLEAAVPGLDVVMAGAREVALTVIAIVSAPEAAPRSCAAIVELTGEGRARYVETAPGGRVETDVRVDGVAPSTAEAIARRLASRPAPGGSGRSEATSSDPAEDVRLVTLLGASVARDLDPSSAWLRPADLVGGHHPELLRAPIGVGGDGRTVELDLKEAAAGGMGPHGILVGATGSGKSELLRSLVTALAARHDPGLLNLLLVDFKGGAAFSELAELPHVSGLVTNLAEDLSLVARVQKALEGELERRQQVLRRAGNLESITALHARPGREAMAHLLIVVDEFGELLAARPDFMDIFATVGSLGRSLGMHLLLATQRLDEAGVRRLEPHLRYRIGLRTYTVEESRAVLGSTAAFELPPRPGLGYLKVDDSLTRFKAGLLGPTRLRGEEAGGRSDLRVIVDRIGRSGSRAARAIWLDPLPSFVTPSDRAGADQGWVVLGLVDMPQRQAQPALVYDWRGQAGNLGIAGAPRTGKSSLLRTLAAELVRDRSPRQVQLYCLDLGGGGLADLVDLPHVGAVVGRSQPELAVRMLSELRGLVDDRAGRRPQGPIGPPVDTGPPADGGAPADTGPPADGGSDADAEVFLIIDNVGFLRHALPDLEALVSDLASCGLQHGVHVIVSAHRWIDVRPALLDALGSRLELHLGDPADSLVGRSRALEVPADVPGRGLTRDGHFFQAAVLSGNAAAGMPGERAALADVVARARAGAHGGRAPAISQLPEVVSEEEVSPPAAAAGSAAPGAERFLLGVSEMRGRPVELDLLSPGAHLIAYGDTGSGRTTLLRRAVLHLLRGRTGSEVAVHLVDPARGLTDLAGAVGPASYTATRAGAEKLALRLGEELACRQPHEDLTLAQLQSGGWWQGPQHVLVVDDYERLLSAAVGPLSPLVELLGSAAEIGLHVLLSRRAAGAQRQAFEPFIQRLREMTPSVMIMSGSSDEGPLVSGVTPRPLPPGRGMLVGAGGRPQLVQCCRGQG